MEKIAVCSTCDALYLKHLAVSLCSMKQATPDAEITLYHLPGKCRKRDLWRFKENLGSHSIEVFFLEGNTTLPPEYISIFKNRQNRHITADTLCKLWIPSYLPGGIDRVLYVDPDTIFTDDARALFSHTLGDCVIGACKDMPEDGRRLPCPLIGGYFNAGVMLIDVRKWLDFDVYTKSLEAARLLHGINQSTDQDILNVALNGHWYPLPGKWNLQVGAPAWYKDSELNNKSKGLLHFTGPTKPWLIKRWSPLDKVYMDVFKRTDYPCLTVFGKPLVDNFRRFIPRVLKKFSHWNCQIVTRHS